MQECIAFDIESGLLAWKLMLLEEYTKGKIVTYYTNEDAAHRKDSTYLRRLSEKRK